jgi:hypothetical protein
LKLGLTPWTIQGIGLRAWKTENGHFGTIEEELRGGKPPKLDRPARDLLMDFDPKTGIHHPENNLATDHGPLTNSN